MPPRWPRKPDRHDSAYRRLDDRMTFATHVAAFAAANSGLWFFRLFSEKFQAVEPPGGLPGTPWITGLWAAVLVAHGVYVFAIARYPETETSTSAQSGIGFGAKPERKSS